MKRAVKLVELISEYSGQIAKWLCVALVLVLVYETIARYVFNAPTIWAYETSWMVGSSAAVLGWSYTHRHDGHIRVDVIYSHLSPRGRAIIDIVCSLIFLFPLLAVLINSSISSTLFAVKMNERLVESNWMPPAAPIKAVMIVGICLFTLQCLTQFVRDSYLLIRNKTL